MSVPALIDLGVPRRWLEAELVRRDLGEFVRRAWEIIEPGTDLLWGRHLDLICQRLEAVTRGELRQLVIMIPPGHAKSLLVSVFWPAWEWLSRPEERTIFASHDDTVVLRDSVRTRQIIESPKYAAWVEALAQMEDGEAWGLARDQNAKGKFENSRRGFRQCTTVKGKITGSRADKLVVDDPYDVKEAVLGDTSRIAERMAEVVTWFDKILSSRLNNKATGKRILIMQRVHEHDLAGVLAQRQGWEVLCLPTEYEPDHPHVCPDDWRQEAGELLFPELFPPEVVDEIRVELDEEYEAQHQQRPSPRTGKYFNRAWLKYCDPDEVPTGLRWVRFWDIAASTSKRADHTASLRAAQDSKGNLYLAAGIRGKWEWPDARVVIVETAQAESDEVYDVGVEAPGIVKVTVDDLATHKVWNIVALHRMPATGDKMSRANPWVARAKRGQVIVVRGPWVETFVSTWESFPRGAHDDCVDAVSGCCELLNENMWEDWTW